MNIHLLLKLTRKTVFALAVILICVWSVLSCTEGATSENDWLQWRGPNRDGISSEKGWSIEWPEGGPKQLWKVSVGKGFSAVSISRGRAYIVGNMNNTDTIYCLDANTGSEIWKYSYPHVAEGENTGPASTPTVISKYVYTLSRNAELFCLDSESGKLIWSKDLQKEFGAKYPGYGSTCSPLVLDRKVIVHAGMILALDRATGGLIWKTKDYGGGYSSPFAFQLDGLKTAVFSALGLVILDPKNGNELMQQPWNSDNDIHVATPIISGDKVFVSANYDVGGVLIQISGEKPVIIWENKNMRNHFNSCVLWEGHLYGFDESAELRCLDFQTGTLKWSQKGLGKSSLMIADSKLIILTEGGELVIAETSPDSFKQIARAKVLDGLCWTVPVLSNGKIYCRNYEGNLICLDVSR